MSETEKGVWIGLGIAAVGAVGAWLALRANWPTVRKVIADNVQNQVMSELRQNDTLYTGLNALVLTATAAASEGRQAQSLDGVVYEKLSGKVADGIGDSLKLR